MKEARFRSTIQQQFDFSCGSAALATLLTYHYEHPVTEQEVFDAMFEKGNQEKIRAQGFSLLDIKNYLEAHGFSAGGYQANLDKLASLGVPAIVLININGYKHFVVVKGVSASEVLLSDPAAGSRSMPRKDFEAMWNGLLFLVRNNKDLGNRHFNVKNEWLVREKAPLGAGLTNTELDNVTFLFH
ncbi:C39 family peptidase [Geomesophilobacter sediminis]|nr:C39 family peptidase [Geomesophilobacter sediminis]